MKPSPEPHPVASHPPIAPCPYITYTALLLLQSSSLLAKVGSSAGMEPRRQQPARDARRAFVDPLSLRPAPASNPSDPQTPFPAEPLSPLSPDGSQRKRRPMGLRSPPARPPRRESEDDDFLSPTHSSLVTQFYPPEAPRSAPASTITYNRSISGPGPSTTHLQPGMPSGLASPGTLGRSQTTAWDSPRSPPTTTQFYFPSCWDPTPSARAPGSRSRDEPPTPLRIARTYPPAGAPGDRDAWDAADAPPHYPSGQRRSSARVQTFDDETELHQFAEATSGFDPFSPVRTRPLTEYYAPRPYSHSQPLPQQPFAPPFDRGSVGLVHSGSAIAEVLQAVPGDDEHFDDDELPDYEQSQAEAHSMQRREAAQRAAELERRWRDSRRRTHGP